MSGASCHLRRLATHRHLDRLTLASCRLKLIEMERDSDIGNSTVGNSRSALAHGRKTQPTSQTADRALVVLRAMLEAEHPLALGEIARRCGLAPSTTHRLLASLQRHNLARQDPETSKYALGLGLLEYGHAILNGLDIREHAAPILAHLNRETHETVHLAVLDGFDLVYIDRRDSHHGVRVHTSIGRRGTPHTTGVGKALLAHLTEGEREAYLARPLAQKTPRSISEPDALREELRRTRERGFAIDDCEDKDHVRCVAAPILGPGGRPLAAVSVSAPDSRFSVERLIALAPTVLEQTRSLSRSLGFRSAHDGRFA
jgi:DNA-binding IclR family transcriptional regulator